MLGQSTLYPPMAMDQLAGILGASSDKNVPAIDMGRGSSSFNALDHVTLNASATQLHQCVPYGDINGMMSLRKKISNYYAETFDYELDPEQVCITLGATEALFLALSLLLEDKGNDKGEVIIPHYYYPAYPILINMLGGRCRYAPVDEQFRLDINALPSLINKSTRAIIVNTPDNPFGQVLSQAELQSINDLGVPLIFDEVYQALPLQPDTNIPSGIHFSQQHFIANSFSKSLGVAGFRLGYLIAPKEQMATVSNAKAAISICTSTPSQVMGEMLLDNWHPLKQQHSQLLQTNWQIFKTQLEKHNIPLLTKPQAGYFANINLSSYPVTAMELAYQLADEYALCTVPDIDFQDSEHLQTNNRFLRFNFACAEEQIKPAIERLATCLQQVK